jgi:hypothetical protein
MAQGRDTDAADTHGARRDAGHAGARPEPPFDAPDPPEAPDPAETSQPPPDILESIRQIGDAGRAGWEATGDVFKSLRTLFIADFSLARSALGRTLALTGVAIVFGGTGWLLLMAALMLLLTRQFGLPWSGALLACAAISLTGAAVAVYYGMRYFDHTRMQATRRQLARLGIGELADFGPRPSSGESSRDAAEKLKDGITETLKDKTGIDVTPP